MKYNYLIIRENKKYIKLKYIKTKADESIVIFPLFAMRRYRDVLMTNTA